MDFDWNERVLWILNLQELYLALNYLQITINIHLHNFFFPSEFHNSASQLPFGPQKPAYCRHPAENSSPACLLPAGVWRAAAKPNGVNGEDLGQKQEETPQGRRKHQEKAVWAGFQHVQRLVQRVWAFVSQHWYDCPLRMFCFGRGWQILAW